ncbi:hypothetical protein M0R45_026009 [Rubus argutus]|uniref:Uncharacterized protein n=1 Tax=Rubus argutus TaxID=59490 RepID=A0AAW1WZN1_RUBAR
MVRYVNSLDELLSSGPSESQIFEGLDEIIPSSVLYSLVASTPIEPQPQPEPQPHVPIQVAEPLALPEGGFLDMIQFVESFAQPEAEPQIQIQAVEQPVQPEAGPSQRKPAKNKRYKAMCRSER